MKNTHVRKNHRLLMPAVVTLVVAMILGWAVAAQAQVVKGSGTTNTIPVWTSSTTIGNSLMKQSGGNVNVNGGIVATNLSGNGSGVTNVNALTLGGLSSTAFAQLGASNTFSMDQAINGNLTLGRSINNTLTLQGNLSDSSLDQGANVIGGFGGNSSFPGNSVASGVLGATIAGGGGSIASYSYPNIVTANWGTVGGGLANTAGGTAATVAGGNQNTASGELAAMGGGNQNTANGPTATVGGGGLNTASGDGATVGGGGHNNASGLRATVSGGESNTASLDGATAAGGEYNTAGGKFATVAGGSSNSATGQYSFAAGSHANANNDGSFVWSDSSGTVTIDTGPNQFVARASGGFTFYTAANFPTGATLAAGSGAWSSLSDRNTKANFSAVDGQALLARLAALPIATWNYKAQPDSIRHMGPTAQDFRAAFGLGEDERHISTVDAQGVALAAIQALYETVTEQHEQIVELHARLAHLEQRH
jgi:hypothetical protein